MSKMRGVGRIRTQKTLPKYVIRYHGAYYYRGPATSWKRLNLGRDFADAMTKFGSLYRETGFATMGDVFTKYEQTVIPTKAAATQASNAIELARCRKVFAHMRAEDPEPVDCYAFRDGVAAKSGPVQANNTLALLKHVFTKAIEWGARKDSPARDVRKIPVAPRTRLPEPWELALVYKHATPMLQCAMDLAELTSMDRGSLLAIRRADLKDDGLHYMRPKTKRRAPRHIVIEWTDELRAVVERAKKLEPVFRQALIGTRDGKPFTPSGFSTLWQRTMVLAEADGLETRFHFHDIRALSISEDVDELEASQRAGHSSLEITRRVYRRKAARVRPLR